MSKAPKKKVDPPPYFPKRVSDWLYATDPMNLTPETRSDLVNACGFFVARARMKK